MSSRLRPFNLFALGALCLVFDGTATQDDWKSTKPFHTMAVLRLAAQDRTLTGVTLDTGDLKIVQQDLKTSSVKELTVTNRNSEKISSEQADVLANLVQSSTHLTHLEVESLDRQAMKVLAAALIRGGVQGTSSLQSLKLSRPFNIDYDILKGMLSLGKLTTFELTYSDLFFPDIFQYINSHLRNLSFGKVNLTDSGIESLTNMLKSNQTLHSLCIHGPESSGKKHVERISDALKSNKTIRQIKLLFHDCDSDIEIEIPGLDKRIVFSN